MSEELLQTETMADLEEHFDDANPRNIVADYLEKKTVLPVKIEGIVNGGVIAIVEGMLFVVLAAVIVGRGVAFHEFEIIFQAFHEITLLCTFVIDEVFHRKFDDHGGDAVVTLPGLLVFKGGIVIIINGIDVTVAEVRGTGDDDKDSARLRGHELYGKSFHWDIPPSVEIRAVKTNKKTHPADGCVRERIMN